VALDRALPSDARILDCGSGTSQLAAFLALSAPRRKVFALDGCRASLACADAFRARVGIPNLNLVRADLFDLPVKADSFEYVISRGVVHHTPDPAEAIRRVARCVGPGGTLVLGFYETWARLFHCARGDCRA
jgi:ubiquinone/menaquinone biosynthesis C-methylase UbiE